MSRPTPPPAPTPALPIFGRLAAPDPRDWELRAYTPAAPLVTRLWAWFYRPLNQGRESTCVGHGHKHDLISGPTIIGRPTSPPSPQALYDLAITLDEWPQNDQDTARAFGTSVRAGYKARQQLGLVDAYAFAHDLDTALQWLCHRGPLVIGVNWYWSMMTTDAEGWLRIAPNDRVAGGHCVLLRGWSERRGAARLVNSWGAFGALRPDGTRDGHAWIDGDTLARLLREDGDFASGVEPRPRP